MAKHRKSHTPASLRRVRAAFGALFTAIALTCLFVAVLAGSANATSYHPTKVTGITRTAPSNPYHYAQYRHVAGNTYQVQLVNWEPNSTYYLFKKKAGSDDFGYPIVTRNFDTNVTFNVGVRSGTSLQIVELEAQRVGYSEVFVAGGPVSTTFTVLKSVGGQ